MRRCGVRNVCTASGSQRTRRRAHRRARRPAGASGTVHRRDRDGMLCAVGSRHREQGDEMPSVASGSSRPDRSISFWYSQIVPPPRQRPTLMGSREADLCIVGGGFTGLWTAYQLFQVEPSLEVLLLEAEVVGFAASGRNGGWVEGGLAGSREHWAARGGRAGAMALERALQGAVDEVGRVASSKGIDCAFHKGGARTVAQSPLQLEKMRAEVEDDRLWGFGPDASLLLDGPAVARRVLVEGAIGALQPALRPGPAGQARSRSGRSRRAGGRGDL